MSQELQMGFFLLLSAVAVIAALGVIFNRNVIYSALALLANFAVLAVLYVLLNAQFIAAIQVVVYAGAIVVLFLFVVMLLGAGGELKIASWLNWHTVFVVAAGLVLLTLIGTAVFDGEIGGVATLPEWRGRGLASVAMEKAAAFMDEELGVEFGLLLVDEVTAPFYRRLGWELVPGPLVFDQPGGKATFPELTMVLPFAGRKWPPGPIDLRGLPW